MAGYFIDCFGGDISFRALNLLKDLDQVAFISCRKILNDRLNGISHVRELKLRIDSKIKCPAKSRKKTGQISANRLYLSGIYNHSKTISSVNGER